MAEDGIPRPEPTEALVGVPTRRVPVPPVPLAVRLADDHGPRRHWSPLATLDSAVLAEVDPAGRVQVAGTSWSLDWWVGAEDRWHHPSMEGSRDSSPVAGTPVRRSAMRVPGGEVEQRCGAVVARAGSFDGPAVALEFENHTGVPVALALAVTPWVLDGRGSVSRVGLDQLDGDGCVVSVDGRPALVLSRPPAAVVSGDTAEVAPRLAAGDDGIPLGGQVFEAGASKGLEVALVLPLAHTATLNALLLPAEPRGSGRRRAGRIRSVSLPVSAPPLESVANGWSTHAGSDPRVSAPQESWADFVAFSGNKLRVAGPAEVTRSLDPSSPTPAGPPSGARLAAVCEALAGLDAEDANNAVAGALVSAQRFSGRVEPADRSDATTALCWCVGALLAGPRGALHADDFVGPAAKAVRWLDRARRKEPEAPIGGAGGHRSAAGLRLLAAGLAAVGQPEVARDALALAAELAVGPVGAAAEDSTFAAARAERDALRASSTDALATLAERVAPRRGSGLPDAVGAPSTLGFDAAELAETRLGVLDTLVRDAAPGPELLAPWPAQWSGNPVEVHGVRTAWGAVSFGLRWHGERPALLWQVEPLVGDTDSRSAPALRVPDLDPEFTGTTWEGEALLESPRTRTSDSAAGGVGEGQSFS